MILLQAEVIEFIFWAALIGYAVYYYGFLSSEERKERASRARERNKAIAKKGGWMLFKFIRGRM